MRKVFLRSVISAFVIAFTGMIMNLINYIATGDLFVIFREINGGRSCTFDPVTFGIFYAAALILMFIVFAIAHSMTRCTKLGGNRVFDF